LAVAFDAYEYLGLGKMLFQVALFLRHVRDHPQLLALQVYVAPVLDVDLSVGLVLLELFGPFRRLLRFHSWEPA